MLARRAPGRGFTLVELMVVVALAAIIIATVAPSLRRLIEAQRVRAVNAQLVTDLQFARSEAATRNAHVRITFRVAADKSCYSIYTYSNNLDICDCLLDAPCSVAGFTELKTTRIGFDTKVRVVPIVGQPREFAFEPLTGSLYTIPVDVAFVPLTNFVIRTRIDAQRELRTTVGQSGRPVVCAPAGSELRETPC